MLIFKLNPYPRFGLKYKCENAGVLFNEVKETYTSQTYSCCRSRDSSPKGRVGLRIREWTCKQCGTLHARDTNASNNIRQQALADVAGIATV